MGSSGLSGEWGVGCGLWVVVCGVCVCVGGGGGRGGGGEVEIKEHSAPNALSRICCSTCRGRSGGGCRFEGLGKGVGRRV